MKTKLALALVCLSVLALACRSTASSLRVTAPLGTEFFLVVDQFASIADTDLMLTVRSVPEDERCPGNVECAASGPVTVTIAVRQGKADAQEFTLQTFTDTDGHSPASTFEGIVDRVEVGAYLVRVTGVLPYPKNSSTEIKPSEYLVSFVVTRR